MQEKHWASHGCFFPNKVKLRIVSYAASYAICLLSYVFMRVSCQLLFIEINNTSRKLFNPLKTK